MLSQEKLKIYQDDTLLLLEYKWFSPIALFMVFFCVVWFAFLAFWYGMAASSGAPWIFFVFPLIHVSVGVGLAYYALCLLFNKTKIIVNYNQLNVLHYPIPWWRGNRKMNADDLTQVYVKEKVKSGKNNSKTYTYTIRALLKNGEDIELAAIGGLESHDAKSIESYLEQYLGIDDAPVKGEFGEVKTAKGIQLPRGTRRSTLPGAAGRVYSLSAGDDVFFNNNSFELGHLTQYDWHNGQSDKLLQLLPAKGKDILIFLQKNNALVEPFVEDLLDLQESHGLSFSPSDPPTAFSLHGQHYILKSKATGQAFLTGVTQPVAVSQWLYQSADDQSHVRVVANKDMISYYFGQKTALSAFEDPAEELLDLPELDRDKLPDWEDEELV